MAAAVEGLRDMQVAFGLAGKTASKEMRTALRQVAEPVRAGAQTLASQSIHVSAVNWSEMRTQVSLNMVYVAPKQRGRRSKYQRNIRRPNLAPILARAMETSLALNEPVVVRRMERVVDTVARKWETA